MGSKIFASLLSSATFSRSEDAFGYMHACLSVAVGSCHHYRKEKLIKSRMREKEKTLVNMRRAQN